MVFLLRYRLKILFSILFYSIRYLASRSANCGTILPPLSRRREQRQTARELASKCGLAMTHLSDFWGTGSLTVPSA